MRWRQMYFTLQTLPIWVVRWQDHRKKHFITSGNVMRQVLPSKALNIHKTLSRQPNKICRVCVYTFTDFLWLLCEWQCLYIFVYLIFFHIYVYWCFLYLFEYAWMFFQNGVYKCFHQHLACVFFAHIFQFFYIIQKDYKTNIVMHVTH